MVRVFDSHQHFWSLASAFHQWPGPDLPAIHRDFDDADLQRATSDVVLTGTIAVQAQPDERETEWLLALAGRAPLIKGVVGWTALDAPDADDAIARLAARPGLVGLRPMLQGLDDPDWILRDAVAPALAAMVSHDLRFDALIRPRHLRVIHALARRWPDLRIVVDHCAKPDLAEGDLNQWHDDIAALADLPNIWCKLSGLRTEQALGDPGEAALPAIHHVLHHLPRRVMWGSDWPVVLLADARYVDWLGLARRAVQDFDPSAVSHVFERCGPDFYGVAASDS